VPEISQPADLHRRNRLLAALPADAFDFLAERLTVTDVATGEMLYEKDQTVTHAVFPHDCTLSVVAVMTDGRSAEAGNIGNEGCFGIASGFADRRATNRCVVQVPGAASLLPIERLDEAMAHQGAIRELLMRYVKAVLYKTQRYVACSSVHTADMRCCRRLLMMHDRVPDDTFALTQDELARILGVRRATVGQICASLQEAGVIRYSRGTMTILDRARLEASSCECYGEVRRIFQRLLPKTYEPWPD
jgi:CRP-like cAMP-binding protein